MDGKHRPVPQYYVQKLKEEEQQQLKKARMRQRHSSVENFRRYKAEHKPERLAVREFIRAERLKRLKRTL